MSRKTATSGRLVFLAALCLAATLAISQTTEPRQTKGSWNGRMWKQFDTPSRYAYLLGHTDGMEYARQITNDSFLATVSTYNLTYGETLKLLDRFYSDPLNAPITISAALELIRWQAKGMTQERFDELLRLARKLSQ